MSTMKKTLLSAFTLFMACMSVANADTIGISSVNIEQPASDTLLFALPVNVNVYQDIQNYPDADPGRRMMKFQPEYLVTATDFTKGDTNVGTACLPANAKVIGLALDGYDVASDQTPHGTFLEVTAWCRNIPASQLEMSGIDLFDGYSTNPPMGDLFTDTVTYRGYRNHPGYICTFDPEANAENPGTIVDIPFNNPDVDGIHTPFWYKGENIYLTLWMCNWEDIHMKYRYMAFDEAEAECASLMRSGSYCFNNDTYEVLDEYFGVALMYELPVHRLPAFRTPYFTNDIRITINNDAEIVLKDGRSYLRMSQSVVPYKFFRKTVLYYAAVHAFFVKVLCDVVISAGECSLFDIRAPCLCEPDRHVLDSERMYVSALFEVVFHEPLKSLSICTVDAQLCIPLPPAGQVR